ncbi:MAG: hypothetical protein ACK4NN_05130 [Rheinheimera sp.]
MKTEHDLQQRLAKLPDYIEPQRDLWPELATRLAQTPQQPVPEVLVPQEKSSTGWWLAAAAVALLALWTPWQFVTEQPTVAQHVPAVGQPALEVPAENESLATLETTQALDWPSNNGLLTGRSQATSETQWRLSNEYEQQRALQLAQIKQVPDIYQDWKQQLQIWQQATDLVLLALQYQPDEPGLLRQLSKLQQQELAYLQKVVQADQT